MLVYKARLTPNTGKPRTRPATDSENRDPLNRKQQGVLDAPAAPVRRSDYSSTTCTPPKACVMSAYEVNSEPEQTIWPENVEPLSRKQRGVRDVGKTASSKGRSSVRRSVVVLYPSPSLERGH